MERQVTNYQCLSCNGPLHFVGETGMLECDYCGSKFSVEQIDEAYGNKEQTSPPTSEEKAETHWDLSGLSENWQGEEVKMREYSCPSCGAQLLWEESTAASHCPYCGNPSVAPEQFRGMLKPDYVIPFELSPEEAKKALKEFYKGKKLLPKEFAAGNRIDKLQGVYVPFWLFDGKAEADVHFLGTISSTRREGDYDVISTSYYDAHRVGAVPFEKIPVDASVKMPDEYMDSLEPFDYGKIRPFSMSYLPGYLAERYGLSPKQCMNRADSRAQNTARDVLRSDVRGYGSLSVKSESIYLDRGKVSYALLPVYILNTKYDGKDYLFAMNGQTGKFVGDLPVSKKKYWAYFLSVFAGVTAVIGTALTVFL
ncbi:MAG: zinc ribbon domain-containing protein [Firmicutes bacterium]|nr:zinc ribbon domain-containing protein [Bacillota bacterium]MBR6585611.1 zinc ribbon domain-containing protein [Bacillota bacterium]